LEEAGYYSDEKRKEKLNEVMTKVKMGLVIEKARKQKNNNNKK